MNQTRIFLADDHTVVREGLKKLINEQPGMLVVGEAANGRTASFEAVTVQPDIVVMDISMPEMNGIEATRRLKKLQPDIKILALTMYEDISYLREIMEAGASGYLLKIAAGGELIHALTAVASGGTYLDPALAGKVVAGSMGESAADEPGIRLSAREAEAVRLVAEGHSNKEIAAQMHCSDKTVETYRARAMSKLGFRGRADFVRYALQKGWLKKEFDA